MDVTTILAVVCSAAVMLAWFVLPHNAVRPAAEAPSDAVGGAEALPGPALTELL